MFGCKNTVSNNVEETKMIVYHVKITFLDGTEKIFEASGYRYEKLYIIFDIDMTHGNSCNMSNNDYIVNMNNVKDIYIDKSYINIYAFKSNY